MSYDPEPHEPTPEEYDAYLNQRAIFDAIAAERQRQDSTWGEQNHPNEVWLAVLTEEVGEVAQCVLQNMFDEPNPDEIDKAMAEIIKIEITQVAAVCVAWLEKLEESK